ncbi:pteridine-dependent deoxygenase [Dokdonella koreensis]|uniref:Pteridine-dependent deoxygenase n=1 Tax=Dokdonella koreensis DS-123 TaxID=1300342 RepID=A0A167G2V8_9GAMM|nr:pteridine-dependent deoxygenase [Dokdonella koreensis]ANB16096.1 Pteridine-dependent deoxygenase [Dokdonella koreensis DS-123]
MSNDRTAHRPALDVVAGGPSHRAAVADRLPALRIALEQADPSGLLARDDVLAVIGFGRTGLPADPRCLRVGLEPIGPAPLEVWYGQGPVRHGEDAGIRWSRDEDYTFFAIEVAEEPGSALGGAAERLYRRLGTWLAAQPHHLLRLWNYFDAINDGDGDEERYRQFCTGRVLGMQDLFGAVYPAATVIGRRDGERVLQVYGLAARRPGEAIENPRQLSAWRYPRDYGPTAPRFARAMRSPGDQLLISGTAAIVGHASRHREDVVAQLEETLANLDSLCAAVSSGLRLGSGSVLKVYVRRPQDAAAILQRLRTHVPGGAVLVLAGDVCRRELLVEVDGIHG